jgi:hypothetical protein
MSIGGARARGRRENRNQSEINAASCGCWIIDLTLGSIVHGRIGTWRPCISSDEDVDGSTKSGVEFTSPVSRRLRPTRRNALLTKEL